MRNLYGCYGSYGGQAGSSVIISSHEEPSDKKGNGLPISKDDQSKFLIACIRHGDHGKVLARRDARIEEQDIQSTTSDRKIGELQGERDKYKGLKEKAIYDQITTQGKDNKPHSAVELQDLGHCVLYRDDIQQWEGAIGAENEAVSIGDKIAGHPMKPKTQSSMYIVHFCWFGETRSTSAVKQHLGKMKNEAKKAHDNYAIEFGKHEVHGYSDLAYEFCIMEDYLSLRRPLRTLLLPSFRQI
ncbi:MAG: hypothetical protein Q9226_008877 [Calogaya cf. arnoldii]